MSSPLDASADRHFDAIVIGGGIAGLAAAWEFTRAGLRPVILEARGYLGGQIAALEVAGARIDIGADYSISIRFRISMKQYTGDVA